MWKCFSPRQECPAIGEAMNVCSIGSMGLGLSDSCRLFNLLYPHLTLLATYSSMNGLVPIAAPR